MCDSESDDDPSLEYEKSIHAKEADPYLVETVRLLNEGCINANRWKNTKKEDRVYGVHIKEWNITHIDYDFKECTKYCMFIESWDVFLEESRLCDSCAKILKERIGKLPFNIYNKSQSALINDFISLQKQMDQVLERLTKLEETGKK